MSNIKTNTNHIEDLSLISNGAKSRLSVSRTSDSDFKFTVSDLDGSNEKKFTCNDCNKQKMFNLITKIGDDYGLELFKQFGNQDGFVKVMCIELFDLKTGETKVMIMGNNKIGNRIKHVFSSLFNINK